MNLELSDREQMLLESVLRMVLSDLLDGDPMTVEDYTAVLTNLNNGSFGEKQYKFDDPNDWMTTLLDLRTLLDRLNPEWVEICKEKGVESYIEEDSDYEPLD